MFSINNEGEPKESCSKAINDFLLGSYLLDYAKWSVIYGITYIFSSIFYYCYFIIDYKKESEIEKVNDNIVHPIDKDPTDKKEIDSVDREYPRDEDPSSKEERKAEIGTGEKEDQYELARMKTA